MLFSDKENSTRIHVALISPGPSARFWGGKKGKGREGRTGRREGRGGNKRG